MINKILITNYFIDYNINNINSYLNLNRFFFGKNLGIINKKIDYLFNTKEIPKFIKVYIDDLIYEDVLAFIDNRELNDILFINKDIDDNYVNQFKTIYENYNEKLELYEYFKKYFFKHDKQVLIKSQNKLIFNSNININFIKSQNQNIHNMYSDFKNKTCKFLNFKSISLKNKNSICCNQWLKLPLNKNNNNNFNYLKDSIDKELFLYCNKNVCNVIKLKNLNDKRDMIDHINVDVMLDKSCNLICPSCRNNLINNDFDNNTYLYFINEYDKIYNETPLTKYLIMCSDGDPFYSKLYRKILFNFDIKKYPNTKFIIKTNGQLMSHNSLRKLKYIYNNIHKFSISIDAIDEEIYKIVRKNGNLKQVLKNIEFLILLKTVKKLNFSIQLNFIISSINYKNLETFIDYFKNKNVIINISKIDFWDHFDLIDYRKLAIHIKDHPEYNEYINIINKIKNLNLKNVKGNVF